MSGKTNYGLVEYAKAQLGKPYWYGTFGQIGTEALYTAKKKQWPVYYKWEGTAMTTSRPSMASVYTTA